ncbi:ANTAR domain-containing protein [Alteromonas sp. 5E99-2]|uniref:ANTAR domain-containing response regulator n=1 Tax=Alteromonas sp. 5E99-2 TaxID=2817683 RepID=UPI001A983084|nr:ANTAR domain-containing protein [Alteromonas sp. 5E99-2]MBO1254227.1 ANTAR domain-containing protein [Alteromonas sp. 5E99-2]
MAFDSCLQVLLIEKDAEKAQKMINALDPEKYSVTHLSSGSAVFLRLVEEYQPDLILMDVESPDRDIVESLSVMSAANPKPVVMFSQNEDTDTINSLVKSGVSAYIVGDVDPTRVRTIIEIALARFDEHQQLKNELASTQQQLTKQKTVEQAKIWLMETKGLTEKEAYSLLRKNAMDMSQTIEHVAKNILSVATMLDM